MKVEIWRPGTNKEFDNLFEKFRVQQYQDKTHRYWENYSEKQFQNCVAYSLYFNDFGEVEVCSSISKKNCWPDSVYRVMNRLWKVGEKRQIILKSISDSTGHSTISQIKWLKENTDCKLYFISRQTDNWVKWLSYELNSKFGTDLRFDKYKYLTCPNETDSKCWQRIIYEGDETVLNQWKRKCTN